MTPHNQFLKGLTVFLLPLFLLIMVASFFLQQTLVSQGLEEIRTRQNELLDQAIARLTQELGFIRRSTLLVKSQLDYNLQRDGRELDRAQLQQRIEQNFVSLADDIEHLSQIRWVSRSGTELVRVNRHDTIIEVVPDNRLQDKSQRFYFREALKVPVGSVYLSPIDLNVEQGKIVIPYEPTIRAVVQSRPTESLPAGLLILNLNLQSLLSSLRDLAERHDQYLELIDQSGHWLIAPDPSMEWGMMKPDKGLSLANKDPEVWQGMQEYSRRSDVRLNGSLSAYTTLQTNAGTGDLIIRISSRQPVVSDISRYYMVRVVGGMLLACLGLIYVGSRVAVSDYQRNVSLTQLQAEEENTRYALNRMEEAYRERKLIEEDLVEASKLSALGMMVAGVAHELNTPTGAIRVTVSTLKDNLHRVQDKLPDRLTRADFDNFLARIEEGLSLLDSHSAKAAELILSFKRLASDRGMESLRRFPLTQVVGDVLKTLDHIIRKTPIRVKTDIPDSLELQTYAGLLSQILQNLISNSLSHAFDELDEGTIEISARALDDNQVEIIVKDNGRGIAPEIRERIFEPFVTSGRHSGHTGFGMHLVHRWVFNDLLGVVRIDSELGKGTRTRIIIPRDLADFSHPAALFGESGSDRSAPVLPDQTT